VSRRGSERFVVVLACCSLMAIVAILGDKSARQ
jgi:hypothetical protein